MLEKDGWAGRVVLRRVCASRRPGPWLRWAKASSPAHQHAVCGIGQRRSGCQRAGGARAATPGDPCACRRIEPRFGPKEGSQARGNRTDLPMLGASLV